MKLQRYPAVGSKEDLNAKRRERNLLAFDREKEETQMPESHS